MNGKPTRPLEKGHLLLVAIVLITTLTVLLAMAVQPVATQRQRLKEQQLIYRAEHLTEGIKRFYLTRGHFPFELKDLLDNEPRLIRQLYADPMTDDGEWTLVYLLPTDLNAVKDLDSLVNRLLNPADAGNEVNSENVDEGEPGLSGRAESAFALNDRQITGIRSKSDKEGFVERDHSRIYSDWLFSALPKPKTPLDQLFEGAR